MIRIVPLGTTSGQPKVPRLPGRFRRGDQARQWSRLAFLIGLLGASNLRKTIQFNTRSGVGADPARTSKVQGTPMVFGPAAVPESGQLVSVRSRRWVVSEVNAGALPGRSMNPLATPPQHLVSTSRTTARG
jgi:hypothetical protein